MTVDTLRGVNGELVPLHATRVFEQKLALAPILLHGMVAGTAADLDLQGGSRYVTRNRIRNAPVSEVNKRFLEMIVLIKQAQVLHSVIYLIDRRVMLYNREL